MFCFQCEQTEHGTGCTTIGVCGKTPEVAALQDLLIDCLKGVCAYSVRARELGASDAKLDAFVLQAMFATVTNVNFDSDRIIDYVKKAHTYRDLAKNLYEQAAAAKGVEAEQLTGTATFDYTSSTDLEAEGRKVSIPARKAVLGDDVVGLQEMTVYGLKGSCAYAEHARVLGKESPEVHAALQDVLNTLNDPKPEVPTLLANALRVGEINLKVMELLDAGSTEKYGHPEPTVVTRRPSEGKCILVSGHDLRDIELILQATEGTGINVYTHGELLPAHSYPGLKKYPHLKGHYGGPWQLQKFEFSQFPGAIVMTTNCLIEPLKSYKGRLFTRSVVGWPGVTHIENDDFSGVVQAALEADGFDADDIEDYPDKTYTVGFGHNSVMGVADKVIDGVKSGAISHFFLVGGCDGSEGERSYFRDVAIKAPEDSIILTLGCGKFRVNDLNLGDIGGIPRVLDMGQCNDAFSAIQVAVALAKAFDTDVNGLPLSFAVSWFEQKAVAVLLTLLHLGVKGIRLGPNLPGFATPAMVDVLVSEFDLKPIGNIDEDMAKMIQNQ